MSKAQKPKIPADPIKLTAADRAILKSHASVLDSLAAYLGSGYEFVLHSLENLDASVVKIINGSLTGRAEGAPITDLALRMLARINDVGSGEGVSYFAKTRSGEPLKSTTIIIRGEAGVPIGLLCINFRLNTPLQDILAHLTHSPADANAQASESFGVDVADTLGAALDAARKKVSEMRLSHASIFNKTVVAVLNEQGIFKLKGAVPHVAEALGISRNTVYLHLRSCQAGRLDSHA